MTRPGIVLAHFAGLDAFDATALDRLDRAGRVLDRTPFDSWDGPSTDELLAETERRREVWAPPPGASAPGNWDKTIGLVSASLIGRRVAALLQPFPHLRVEIYDPLVSAAESTALGATKVHDLLELCRHADVLSIHAPALPQTENLIGAAALAALRPGATVINTSRGHCLDLDAFTVELEAGRLFAIIDVSDPIEPLPDHHPLRRLPNAILTPAPRRIPRHGARPDE